MKEFVVCYSLENDVKRERIIKELDVKKEEIVQEVLEKIKHSNYIIVKEDQGDIVIDTSLIRYIRVLDANKISENQLVFNK